MRRFGSVVERILGDLDGQVGIAHDHLATKARLRFQAPCLVQHVLFQLVGFFERIEALAHDAVASGAGLDAAAGTPISM